MTDLMDRRLAGAARQWQAQEPPPPGVPLGRLDERLPRRPSVRSVLAAAAVVVLVGAGTVAVTRAVGSDRAAPVGTTTSPPPWVRVHRAPQVVRWRNLPAGHPDVRHHEHGRVVTPFDHVAATGSISGRFHPGDTLEFVAVLESPRTVKLDPCPDFSIAFGKHSWHTWRLNCAQVPFKDGHGRPLLPALRDVRFEMKVQVPDEHGEQKVLWTLDGPQQMPGFYGLVHVSRG